MSTTIYFCCWGSHVYLFSSAHIVLDKHLKSQYAETFKTTIKALEYKKMGCLTERNDYSKNTDSKLDMQSSSNWFASAVTRQ